MYLIVKYFTSGLAATAAIAQSQPSQNQEKENLLRLSTIVEPLMQQRDAALNALAFCQGDLKTVQDRLKAAELKAMEPKSPEKPP